MSLVASRVAGRRIDGSTACLVKLAGVLIPSVQLMRQFVALVALTWVRERKSRCSALQRKASSAVLANQSTVPSSGRPLDVHLRLQAVTETLARGGDYSTRDLNGGQHQVAAS
jgi:hypothetical protein